MSRHRWRIVRRHTVAAHNVVIGVADQRPVRDQVPRPDEEGRVTLSQNRYLFIAKSRVPDRHFCHCATNKIVGPGSSATNQCSRKRGWSYISSIGAFATTINVRGPAR